MEAVADRGHVAGNVCFDAANGLTCERTLVDGPRIYAAHGAGALRIGCTHVEMRALSIVADEKRASVLETTVEMHDGDPRAVRSDDDAIARLENEAAEDAHALIVRDRVRRRECASDVIMSLASRPRTVYLRPWRAARAR
jgi:hypothetical protein